MATTKEQVWAAADSLAAEGRNPTLAAVRECLGGGSYTDISAAMQVWKANRQASAAPIREPAPTAVTDRLGELGGEIWTIALELANGRLQAEREALEQARQEMEQARQEAADLADQLSADLETAQAAAQRQADQLAADAAEIERLRAESRTRAEALTAAVHRADTAEAARAELQRRADQLGALLDREREAHAQAAAEARRLAEQNARLHAEKDAAERRAAEAEARAAKTEQEAVQARREAESARSAGQAAQARLESATREIEDLRERLGSERAAAREAGELAAELRGRLAALEATPGAGKDADVGNPRRSKKTNPDSQP
jgi:chromosome segregation ATPase